MDEVDDVEPNSELSAETELITVPIPFHSICGELVYLNPGLKPQYIIGTLNREVQAPREKSGGAGVDAATREVMRWWNYCSSFRTACCAWLDCDSAAMPVCCRTLYCVIVATVLPMSAFWMSFEALVRLVTSVLSTFWLAVS